MICIKITHTYLNEQKYNYYKILQNNYNVHDIKLY